MFFSSYKVRSIALSRVQQGFPTQSTYDTPRPDRSVSRAGQETDAEGLLHGTLRSGAEFAWGIPKYIQILFVVVFSLMFVYIPNCFILRHPSYAWGLKPLPRHHCVPVEVFHSASSTCPLAFLFKHFADPRGIRWRRSCSCWCVYFQIPWAPE